MFPIILRVNYLMEEVESLGSLSVRLHGLAVAALMAEARKLGLKPGRSPQKEGLIRMIIDHYADSRTGGNDEEEPEPPRPAQPKKASTSRSGKEQRSATDTAAELQTTELSELMHQFQAKNAAETSLEPLLRTVKMALAVGIGKEMVPGLEDVVEELFRVRVMVAQARHLAENGGAAKLLTEADLRLEKVMVAIPMVKERVATSAALASKEAEPLATMVEAGKVTKKLKVLAQGMVTSKGAVGGANKEIRKDGFKGKCNKCSKFGHKAADCTAG